LHGRCIILKINLELEFKYEPVCLEVKVVGKDRELILAPIESSYMDLPFWPVTIF
jgi:hypothetical protein